MKSQKVRLYNLFFFWAMTRNPENVQIYKTEQLLDIMSFEYMKRLAVPDR